MLENNFKSGCLVVISNDFASNYKRILEKISFDAEREWNSYDDWNGPLLCYDHDKLSFSNYYNLSADEKNAFDLKEKMPNSFIDRFVSNTRTYILTNRFNCLFHKQKPNTRENLIEAFDNKKMYEVKCEICGRTYFTDEQTICCVKWKSCCGADCLSSISNEVSTYENLCTIKDNNEITTRFKNQLANVKNIVKPLSYYEGLSGLKVSYISDIHLLHHVKKDNLTDSEIRSLINVNIRKLYSTMADDGIIVFAGDISSDANVTLRFYETFVKYYDYLLYKDVKKNVFSSVRNCLSIHDIEKKIRNLKEYIGKLQLNVYKHLDFKKVVAYRNTYGCTSYISALLYYKNTPSYRKKREKNKYCKLLENIAKSLDLLDLYEEKLNELIGTKLEIEKKYGKPICDLKIKDIYKKHHLLSDDRRIFVVLGNHEYINFNSVNEAISFFDDKLSQLGIILLKNSCLCMKKNGKKIVIFGGTGFAKYNQGFNANNLKCCKGFTRGIEINESTAFELEYQKSKKYANEINACFVCVSHYPVHDWSTIIDRDTIYFYGHNHQNFFCRNENEIIYADNQIGYKNFNIGFKTMKTGLEINPYFKLHDGMYKTNIRDYLQFYKYIGESIGDGSLLCQRCKKETVNMYVIKRNEFYGFFIVNESKGDSKGISIVNGGKTKK